MCNFVSFFQLVIFFITTNVHKHLTKPYMKTLFFIFMKNMAQFHKCSNTNLYNSVKKPFDCLSASIFASIQLFSKDYTACILKPKKEYNSHQKDKHCNLWLQLCKHFC